MKVIIAWSGDHIGQEVDRASMADDADGLRRINQAIGLANAIWKSWVELGGGSMVSSDGADGRAEVLAEKLSELPRIRAQYGQTIGSSVSAGIGIKPSEADRALKVAKLRGGDRIVLYTPDIDQELEGAQKQSGPADPLAPEALNKADGPKGPSMPAMASGPAAGFTGASPPSAPTIDTPQVEASEHSQGESMRSLVDEQPPMPEGTHAAEDFEDQFHEAADKDEQQAQGQAVQSGDPQEQVRAQVVQILQALKAQAPILEQIKQTAPDTYATVMAMVQAVITMARQLNGEPTHTTVKELDDRARSQAEIQVPLPPEEGDGEEDTKKSELLFKGQRGDWKAEGYRIRHELTPDGKSMSITAHLGDALVGDMDAAHSHAEPGSLYPVMVRVHPDHRRKGLATAMYQRAEEVLGAKFKRGAYQSPEAKALWDQKSRPFGKAAKSYKLEGDAVIEVDPKTGRSLGKGPVNKDEDFQKNRPTPKFPKLGLPDDRRETPIVNDERSHEIKRRAIANAVMSGENYYENKPGKSPIHNSASEGMNPDHVWKDWSNNVQGMRDQVRDSFLRDKSGSGGANIVGGNRVSYSKGPALRGTDPWDPTTSQQAPGATQLHEDWHMMMMRVQQKHGVQGRANVVSNMLHELKRRDPKAFFALENFTHVRNRATPKGHPHHQEEKVASLLNYLNNPSERSLYHAYSKHGPELTRDLEGHMKRAHQHLMRMGQNEVDPTWALTPEDRLKTVRKAEEQEPKDWHDCVDFGHCWGEGAASEVCVMCGEKQEVEPLDKASLSPGAVGKPPPKRHHLNLPVGSKIDPGPSATRRVGRIKVFHPETGKQGWIQARAGQILSQDGHPISSRNPGGR